jgi:HSP20 family protein
MADAADMQTSVNEANDKAAAAARRGAEATAEAARKGADAMADTAKAGIDAEQRSFAGAASAAQTSLKAGQDVARRASEQAADFWRSSLQPMTEMQTELGRWFEQMWKTSSPARLTGASPFSMLATLTGHPAADLRETDQGFELNVELPGLSAEEVDLSLRGDTLVLSGEKAGQAEGGQGAYRFSERRFGRFERSFPLPAGADRSRIEASFQDGLLRISIPTSPEAEQAQPIRIKS